MFLHFITSNPQLWGFSWSNLGTAGGVHPLVQHSHLSKNLGRLQWFDYIWTWTDAAWTVLRMACWPFFGEDLEDAPFFFSDENGYLWLEEIRRSPVDMVVYPHYLQGFSHHPRWLGMGFLNHQQYHWWQISGWVFGLVNFRGVMGWREHLTEETSWDQASVTGNVSSMSLDFFGDVKKNHIPKCSQQWWVFV